MLYLIIVLGFLAYVCCVALVSEMLCSILYPVTKITRPLLRRAVIILLIVFAPASILITAVIALIMFISGVMRQTYDLLKELW